MRKIKERTFFMLKPDAVSRGLMGEVISRIEQKGLTIVYMEMQDPKREIVEEHYAVHKGKDFFEPNCDQVCSGPVVLTVIEGPGGTVKLIRRMLGATQVAERDPGTIRGDLSLDVRANLGHASDSVENANVEMKLWIPGRPDLLN